jgi:enoyl-CoA hydratase/carnithine racemase
VNPLEVVAAGPGIEVWSLNRPSLRNALEPVIVAALHDAVRKAEATGVRAVVLRGNGPSFCAGADLNYLLSCAELGRSPRPFLTGVCDLTVAVEASPIVFIAALHGHAVAGGLELALSCDLVIAATGTLIGDGHVRNNLVPGGGASVRLLDKVGVGPGTWLALSGELVPAEDLATTGWLHRVVPETDLLATAEATAIALVACPSDAQARMKSLLHDSDRTAELLTRELDAFESHWESSNVGASLTAFLSRNKERSSA